MFLTPCIVDAGAGHVTGQARTQARIESCARILILWYSTQTPILSTSVSIIHHQTPAEIILAETTVTETVCQCHVNLSHHWHLRVRRDTGDTGCDVTGVCHYPGCRDHWWSEHWSDSGVSEPRPPVSGQRGLGLPGHWKPSEPGRSRSQAVREEGGRSGHWAGMGRGRGRESVAQCVTHHRSMPPVPLSLSLPSFITLQYILYLETWSQSLWGIPASGSVSLSAFLTPDSEKFE